MVKKKKIQLIFLCWNSAVSNFNYGICRWWSPSCFQDIHLYFTWTLILNLPRIRVSAAPKFCSCVFREGWGMCLVGQLAGWAVPLPLCISWSFYPSIHSWGSRWAPGTAWLVISPDKTLPSLLPLPCPHLCYLTESLAHSSPVRTV